MLTFDLSHMCYSSLFISVDNVIVDFFFCFWMPPPKVFDHIIQVTDVLYKRYKSNHRMMTKCLVHRKYGFWAAWHVHHMESSHHGVLEEDGPCWETGQCLCLLLHRWVPINNGIPEGCRQCAFPDATMQERLMGIHLIEICTNDKSNSHWINQRNLTDV